jgi:hypothetical protein
MVTGRAEQQSSTGSGSKMTAAIPPLPCSCSEKTHLSAGSVTHDIVETDANRLSDERINVTWTRPGD